MPANATAIRIVLLGLACAPALAWGTDPVATQGAARAAAAQAERASATATKPEDLPYGAGYEAREAARTGASANRPAAPVKPDASPRGNAGQREHAATRGADVPRSASRPPRPERTR